MDQCTQSHRRQFVAWYSSQPEVTAALDEGADVFEFFTDNKGVRHYCFSKTQEALVNWLKDNPEEDRDIRSEFVKELSEGIKLRRDITLYNKHPGLDGPVTHRNDQVESIYMAGARDAVTMVLSMTDDRELNGSSFRLTTSEGKVIPFDHPGDKVYLETPGIIVMFHNEINT